MSSPYQGQIIHTLKTLTEGADRYYFTAYSPYIRCKPGLAGKR